MNVQGVLFCSATQVAFVPDGKEPEDYAGFIANDERVYVTADAKLSQRVREVLSGYENVTIVERMNLL